jgi:hypothetical protein
LRVKRYATYRGLYCSTPSTANHFTSTMQRCCTASGLCSTDSVTGHQLWRPTERINESEDSWKHTDLLAPKQAIYIDPAGPHWDRRAATDLAGAYQHPPLGPPSRPVKPEGVAQVPVQYKYLVKELHGVSLFLTGIASTLGTPPQGPFSVLFVHLQKLPGG